MAKIADRLIRISPAMFGALFESLDWRLVHPPAVRQIAQLYAIETMIRGSSPDISLAARKQHSLPLVEAWKPWFEKHPSMISSGSTFADDNRYAQSLVGLTRFLDDAVSNSTPIRLKTQSGRAA
ncbi:hypothetical protein ACVIGB_008432 [Bradyrhizobium sp. USDA 4341]